eukprot:gene28479-33563_t
MVEAQPAEGPELWLTSGASKPKKPYCKGCRAFWRQSAPLSRDDEGYADLAPSEFHLLRRVPMIPHPLPERLRLPPRRQQEPLPI